MSTHFLSRRFLGRWSVATAAALTAFLMCTPLMAAGLKDAHITQSYQYPVIKHYGGAWIWPGEIKPPKNLTYKAVWEIYTGPKSPAKIVRGLERVANSVNSMVAVGVSLSHIQYVIVLHGAAGKAVLDASAYQRYFHTRNPNAALLKALNDAGVKIMICGVTLAHAGWTPKDLLPYVQPVLSAETAVVRLQAQGYALMQY